MAFLSSSRRVRPHFLLRLFSSSPSSAPSTPLTGGHAFDPTIRRLARLRQFSDIEDLLEPRKKSPHASQEPYLASLLISYTSSGMLDHALRTFNEITSLGSPRTAISLNSLLSACNHHSKLFRQVPDLFSDLSKKYSIAPDKISYGILIKSHCRAGNAKNAFPILKEMEEKKIEITTVTYTTILDSLYKEKKPEEAEKLWKEMGSKGVVLDLPAYNVRVMYKALHGKPEGVLKMIEEIESAVLKPDTITYNYLIVCYCNHGRLEDAKKVYKGLEEMCCGPNAATFKNFLTALCKRGDFDFGLEVFNDSLKQKKVPDLGSVTLLVEGLVKGKKMRAAKRVVTGLKKKFPEDFVREWKKLEKVVGLNVDGEASEQAQAEAA